MMPVDKTLYSVPRKYPLYDQIKLSQRNFKDSFYSRDNPNFASHKRLEQRIFENRQRIISMQKILHPYQNYVKPVDNDSYVPSQTEMSQVKLSQRTRSIPLQSNSQTAPLRDVANAPDEVGPYQAAGSHQVSPKFGGRAQS